jgi:nitroreductase
VELRDALRTTGAVRDFDGTPVDRDTVYDLLETARFAPSGGNRQGWRVVLVEDPARKRALRDLYLPGWYEYLAVAQAGLVPFAVVTDRDAEAAALARAGDVAAAAGEGGFAEHLDAAPVLLVLLADLRHVAALDRDEEGYTFVGGASVYPFAWSLLLAAHDVGLGGVLTTMLRRRADEVRALLGAADHLAVAGLIALGRPVARATRLRRHAVETFAALDEVDGPPLTRSVPRAAP